MRMGEVRKEKNMIKTQQKIWYENELFWQTFGPELFNDNVLERTGREVDQFISLLGLNGGEKILDLCCGIGRHSLELARRGFDVTGLDTTVLYLEQARERAEIENLDVDFVQGDMRRFCALSEFDVVINMYTAFGYFEDPTDDKRVLLNIFTSLKPGGKLLLETMSKEILARIFVPRDWHETKGGGLFLREHRVEQNFSWVHNKWQLIKGADRAEYEFGHRLYSAAELADLAKRCRFAKVDVYGSLDAKPYDHEAERLALIAIK